MTSVNMMTHGCVGEVVWHNSLDPSTYYGGWVINPTLNITGIPGIEIMSKEESVKKF